MISTNNIRVTNRNRYAITFLYHIILNYSQSYIIPCTHTHTHTHIISIRKYILLCASNKKNPMSDKRKRKMFIPASFPLYDWKFYFTLKGIFVRRDQTAYLSRLREIHENIRPTRKWDWTGGREERGKTLCNFPHIYIPSTAFI